MADGGTYDTIAAVYEFLVPDALLSPRGSADAFAQYVAPGARVLDCACGTGTLAVGLALRGHEVVATDASAAMVARTARLAAANGARVDASVCTWEALPERGWAGRASTSCCASATRCRTRSAAPAGAPRCTRWPAACAPAGGSSSPRARGSRCAPTARGCRSASGSSSAAAGAGCRSTRGRSPSAGTSRTSSTSRSRSSAATARSQTHRERFAFWPFTEDELREDLRDAGLEPEAGGVPGRQARALPRQRAPR